jgi:hypothetical protein
MFTYCADFLHLLLAVLHPAFAGDDVLNWLSFGHNSIRKTLGSEARILAFYYWLTFCILKAGKPKFEAIAAPAAAKAPAAAAAAAVAAASETRAALPASTAAAPAKQHQQQQQRGAELVGAGVANGAVA